MFDHDNSTKRKEQEMTETAKEPPLCCLRCLVFNGRRRSLGATADLPGSVVPE